MLPTEKSERLNPSKGHQNLTVIFKGSNRCNAGCAFCAVGELGGKLVTREDFEIVVRELEALVEDRNIEALHFTFHGGEPTMLGAEFLEWACVKIEALAKTVNLSMQSNLLAWDDDVIEVARRHKIKIGTSIDPLNTGRRDTDGNDAFPAWLENYLRLEKEGFHAGAIFVVTRPALGQAQRLYEAAEEISASIGRPFGLQINPVYPQGNAVGSESVLISPQEFGEFLIEIWRLWERSERTVLVTPLLGFVDALRKPGQRPQGLSCSFTGNCSRSHVGIDFDLNVAGCGRRIDSGAYYGNLRDRPLIDLLNDSPEKATIEGRFDRLREGHCQGCEYQGLCHGGCPDDAALAYGDVSPAFIWCESYRMLFDTIKASDSEVTRGPPSPIYTADDPKLLIEAAELPGRKELWVLPQPSGSQLQFEAGLADIPAERNLRLKLWAHNAHAQFLPLWERMMQRLRAGVVLFEAEGLVQAASLLNELNTHIILDAPSIADAEGGPAALEELLKTFVYQGDWQAAISPFDQMLLRAARGQPPIFANWLGLRPGDYEIKTSSQEPVAEYSKEMLQQVQAEPPSLEKWLAARPGCATCPSVDACGGCLRRGDGKPCQLEELAATVVTIGKELKDQLDETQAA